MKSRILIVTSSDEPNVSKVIRFLDGETASYLRIDTDTFFLENKAIFGLKNNTWALKINGEEVYPNDVKSIWYRRPGMPKINQKILPEYRDFAKNESTKFFISLWSMFEKENLIWVNHPETQRLIEFNKPYQMNLASHVGLDVPATLISNSSDDILKFLDQYNEDVVIKPFGGTHMENEQGKRLVIYTKPIKKNDVFDRIEEISLCPCLIQENIPKKIELRVTVIGEDIFSCAIHSQDSDRTKFDWRKYDFLKVKHEAYSLPVEISEKIIIFMKLCNLKFGAIDMIVTPDDKYVFLEVNPSGQWGWIEAITGMPISQSIGNFLINS